jgi:hypothetical protein
LTKVELRVGEVGHTLLRASNNQLLEERPGRLETGKGIVTSGMQSFVE